MEIGILLAAGVALAALALWALHRVIRWTSGEATLDPFGRALFGLAAVFLVFEFVLLPAACWLLWGRS